MEKAYGELLGDYDKMKANGSTYTMWQNLLGTVSPDHNWLLKPMSVNDAVIMIQNAVAANRMVVLSTLAGDKTNEPIPNPYGQGKLFRGHAYVVQSVSPAGEMSLYNPWGTIEDHAKVPIVQLKEFFLRAQIH